MLKASYVQIVEMVRNRRENSRDAVDIVGRFGYYKQVWLFLIVFGYSEAGLVTPGLVTPGQNKGKEIRNRDRNIKADHRPFSFISLSHWNNQSPRQISTTPP